MKGSVLVKDCKSWGRNKLLECSGYFFPFAKSSPDCIKFDFKLLGCHIGFPSRVCSLNQHGSSRVMFLM